MEKKGDDDDGAQAVPESASNWPARMFDGRALFLKTPRINLAPIGDWDLLVIRIKMRI